MSNNQDVETKSASQWLNKAAEELSLDPDIIKQLAGPLLDLTREVAHNRSRPAAPLTAFLVGLSLDSDADSAETIKEATERINRLVAAITPEEE